MPTSIPEQHGNEKGVYHTFILSANCPPADLTLDYGTHHADLSEISKAARVYLC